MAGLRGLVSKKRTGSVPTAMSTTSMNVCTSSAVPDGGCSTGAVDTRRLRGSRLSIVVEWSVNIDDSPHGRGDVCTMTLCARCGAKRGVLSFDCTVSASMLTMLILGLKAARRELGSREGCECMTLGEAVDMISVADMPSSKAPFSMLPNLGRAAPSSSSPSSPSAASVLSSRSSEPDSSTAEACVWLLLCIRMSTSACRVISCPYSRSISSDRFCATSSANSHCSSLFFSAARRILASFWASSRLSWRATFFRSRCAATRFRTSPSSSSAPFIDVVAVFAVPTLDTTFLSLPTLDCDFLGPPPTVSSGWGSLTMTERLLSLSFGTAPRTVRDVRRGECVTEWSADVRRDLGDPAAVLVRGDDPPSDTVLASSGGGWYCTHMSAVLGWACIDWLTSCTCLSPSGVVTTVVGAWYRRV
eukprot:PhM_4_TR1002/c0_g1_i1/m.79613